MPQSSAPTAAPTPKPAAPSPKPAAAPPRAAIATPRAVNRSGAMPAHVQDAIESSYGVRLGDVRIHRDDRARRGARMISARAFTHGRDIALGENEHDDDLALMAHEAAHIVQQREAKSIQGWSGDPGDRYEAEADRAAAAVVRGEPFTVRERVDRPHVQRSIWSRALHWIADHVDGVPGWRMFTIVLGHNPITGDPVDRSAANVMRAIVEFLPGGTMITEALDKYGVFEKVGGWVDKKLDELGDIGSELLAALHEFIDSLGWTDIFHLGDVWDRLVTIFSRPVNHVISFLHSLYDDIVQFVKDAILRPLAQLASRTRAWDLLCAILGKNPITGDPVPRNAETLIGGFMKLIGQEEIWNNMKRANAVARAWQWFQSAMTSLLGFVTEIPGLFLKALKSLKLSDILDPIGAFERIAGIFGDFVGRFISWAGESMWNLLQIIFEVVAPGAMPYLRRVGGALRSIFHNPIGFVRNLVNAGKLGFHQFADHFSTHLKTSFIEWLTGSLPGVYIPKSFDLGEIVKLVMSVLGLTWDNVRGKLVRVIGEPAVRVLETTFDIVVTLVREGPAAAWEKIKEDLAALKDTVIQGIIDYVTTTIVHKAVEKIAGMLVPGGAFIQAIISIYDTIQVFISRLSRIIQVATAFLDSMMQIAGGQIAAAANKVESVLAGLLTLAISFLAGFLGLGKISDKVMEIIGRVRATVDKAIDKLIAWIVNAAKSLVGRGRPAQAPASPASANEGDLRTRATMELASRVGEHHSVEEIREIAGQVLTEFQPQGLKSLEVGPKDEDGFYTVFAEASPKMPWSVLIPRGAVKGGRSERIIAIMELEPGAVAGAPVPGRLPPATPSFTTHPSEGGSLTLTPTPQQFAAAGARPRPQYDTVTSVSWNTTAAQRSASGGHAENEFYNWMTTQNSKDPTFYSRIVSLRLQLDPLSPCTDCGRLLASILGSVRAERGSKPVLATLAWSKLYVKEPITTTWSTVGELARAGWRVSAGEYPEGENINAYVIYPFDSRNTWT